MSDTTEEARRYLILIEGGPPSDDRAWSPDRSERESAEARR
jgi:hypothetical protein